MNLNNNNTFTTIDRSLDCKRNIIPQHESIQHNTNTEYASMNYTTEQNNQKSHDEVNLGENKHEALHPSSQQSVIKFCNFELDSSSLPPLNSFDIQAIFRAFKNS